MPDKLPQHPSLRPSLELFIPQELCGLENGNRIILRQITFQ